jgi:hypothetical protein
MNPVEKLDIETFKQAIVNSHTLRKLDHVRAWIEMEGKRLVEEYTLKAFKNVMDTYPSLTIDDFVWLKEKHDEPRTVENERSLVVFGKYQDIPGQEWGWDSASCVVVRQTGRSRPPAPTGLKYYYDINYNQLLPFNMTHLWGGGYYSIVEDSLLNQQI